MSNQETDQQCFDAALLRLLKTPPKPRPKRERKKAKRRKAPTVASRKARQTRG